MIINKQEGRKKRGEAMDKHWARKASIFLRFDG
jgi:hypothetical protein